MKKKVYLVEVSIGDEYESSPYTIFATTNKRKGEKYITKYNKLLTKLKQHYKDTLAKKGITSETMLDHLSDRILDNEEIDCICWKYLNVIDIYEIRLVHVELR